MLESVSELYQPMCLPLKLLNSLQTFLSDHISFVTTKFIHFYPFFPLTELIRDVWLEFCLLNLSILLASSFLWNLCSQHFFSCSSVPFKMCLSHLYRLYVTIPKSRYGVNSPLPKPCFLPALTWMNWGQSRLSETFALSWMRLLVDFWIMNDLFFLLRV